MAEIMLPAFHVTSVRKLQVEVHHEMDLDLGRYRAFYKQAYGADVAEADIIREMARRFMEADKEFQAFKNTPKARGRTAAKSTTASPSEGACK